MTKKKLIRTRYLNGRINLHLKMKLFYFYWIKLANVIQFFFHKISHDCTLLNNSIKRLVPILQCPSICREAKIWNCVFEKAEKMAGIARGSIRATVLIETLPAVFQMDEILYELRDHSAGLNCGRWDYIFSYVKTFQAHPDRLLPDRVLVGMTQHFMRSYSDLLIRTCHRRGVHAMGGMVYNSYTFYRSNIYFS